MAFAPQRSSTPQLDPTRKYLSASNIWFLALKVFGYNLLGYLILVVPIAIILYIVVVVAGN